MTPVQIAYFKHFMFDKGIAKTYIHMYRYHRIKGTPEGDQEGNPESLEQFLQEQPYFRVIMKAFYFKINSDYGFNFWDEINKQWKKYWSIHCDNFSNSSYANLKGTFAILKQNWDSERYWAVETPEETYKRTGIEPPPDEVNEEDSFVPEGKKFKEGDIIKSTISEEFRKVISVEDDYYLLDDNGTIDFSMENLWEIVEQPDESEVEEEEEVNNDISEPKVSDEKPDFSGVPEYDDELEFFSLNSGSRSKSTRLKENEVSLNFRKGFKLTFNLIISKRIKDNKYKYVRLAKNKQGDIVLQLHKVNDSSNPVSVSFTSNGVNTVINSKDLCEKLKVLLNVSADYSILKVRSLFESYEKANFIISK